jgi:hypothetical protein
MNKNDKDFRHMTTGQLAICFNKSETTVKKMIYGISPDFTDGNFKYWDISKICKLIDFRIDDLSEKEKYNSVYLDPQDMTANDRKAHYQAEDARQSGLLKARKNQLEDYQVIQSSLVEAGIVNAFKSLAVSLDTLPDILERDGMLRSQDVNLIKNIVDRFRDTLANDLVAYSGRNDL